MATAPEDKDSKELIGDLESIRTLLDEEETAASATAPAAAAAPTSADEVPMLDDVVDLPPEAEPEPPQGNLTDDAFASLMSDGWKAETDTLLRNARHAIDEQAEQWSPEDTDELNDALRVRIDATIYDWLQRLLREHIDDLRTEVLSAIADELQAQVGDVLNTSPED